MAVISVCFTDNANHVLSMHGNDAFVKQWRDEKIIYENLAPMQSSTLPFFRQIHSSIIPEVIWSFSKREKDTISQNSFQLFGFKKLFKLVHCVNSVKNVI